MMKNKNTPNYSESIDFKNIDNIDLNKKDAGTNLRLITNIIIQNKKIFKLKDEEIFQLLKKADFNYIEANSSLLMVNILIQNQENFFLIKEQLKELWILNNEQTQQLIFKKLIKQIEMTKNIWLDKNAKNHINKKYNEILDFIFHDAKLILSENTMKWLRKNKYEEMIEKAEKLKLYIQLDKEMNNHFEKQIKNNRIKI